MKVRCIHNKLSDINGKSTREWLKKNVIRVDNDDHEISHYEIGMKYTVYGLVFWNNLPFFYIVEGDNDYPTPKYAGFFEVTDSKYSKYWQVTHSVNDENKVRTVIVFKEWAESEKFYENLLNDEDVELEIFAKYKELMDQE